MPSLTRKIIRSGLMPSVTEPGVLVTGQNLTAGSVLGAMTIDPTAVVVVIGAGNTGNGVFTEDAVTPVLAGAKVGIYNVTNIQVIANAGLFQVTDPDGVVIGLYNVGETFENQIKFAIADGATDFVVGDTFSVEVSAGSGKLKLVNSANIDGSAIPYGILVDDTDATDSDQPIETYLTGEFSTKDLSFGGTDTSVTHKANMRKLGLYLKTTRNV